MRRSLIYTLLFCLIPCYGYGAHSLNKNENPIKIVTDNELLTIMQQARGYNPIVTTNAVRFQIETLLRLLSWARVSYPEAESLFIGYKTWFNAYLAANHLEEKNAPLFIKLAYEYHQDMRITILNPKDVKIRPSTKIPFITADITIWWPKTKGINNCFSFIDMHSIPKLKVINRRVITYRLLDFGDMVVCDNIKGLEGRPISGLLGLMFKFIGEGRVVQTRMAISKDGLQVARAHTKKGLLGVKTTVTVYPNGDAIKGVPANRKDLDELVARLRQYLKII